MMLDYQQIGQDADEMIVRTLTLYTSHIYQRLSEEGPSARLTGVDLKAMNDLRRITRDAQKEREEVSATASSSPEATKFKHTGAEPSQASSASQGQGTTTQSADHEAPEQGEASRDDGNLNRAQRRAEEKMRKKKASVQHKPAPKKRVNSKKPAQATP